MGSHDMISWSTKPVDQFSLVVNKSSSSSSISGKVSSIQTVFGFVKRSGLFRGQVFERALNEEYGE